MISIEVLLSYKNNSLSARNQLFLSKEIKKFTIDKIILNKIAQKRLSTLNPGTNVPTRRIISPLRINVNNPKVTILIGNVRKNKMGLIIAFKIPKTTAATIAVRKLAT